MEVTLLRSSSAIVITEYITSLTISGEYRSCCRTADFGIIQSPEDDNLERIGIALGDHIKIRHDGRLVFYGVVWNKAKDTDSQQITIHCKDFGIYLVKNKGSYNFSGITPEDIVKKVCEDYGIAIGHVEAAGVPISRKFLGVSLYDIIMTAYTLAGDRKYYCTFEGSRLNVYEKGMWMCSPIESGENLLTAGVSESLNQMINKVDIYNKNDVLIKSLENTDEINLYGLMSEYYKVINEQEDYTLKAGKLLNGVERKITVTNMGDVYYTTGCSVIVREPYTRLRGRFFIDEDQHNWQNGIYTNRLLLNFKNLMDEKEGGSSG